MKKTSAIATILTAALGFASVSAVVPAHAQILSNQGEVAQRQAEATGRGGHGGFSGPVVTGPAYRGERGERGGVRHYGNAPRFEGIAPRYYSYNHPRFYRGGLLPYEYRQPAYYVDWRSYPGLYAPPYGYQWVDVGGDLLLVALATGLIANALTY